MHSSCTVDRYTVVSVSIDTTYIGGLDPQAFYDITSISIVPTQSTMASKSPAAAAAKSPEHIEPSYESGEIAADDQYDSNDGYETAYSECVGICVDVVPLLTDWDLQCD